MFAIASRRGVAGPGELIAETPPGGFRPEAWSPDGEWLAGRPWTHTAETRLYVYSTTEKRLVTVPVSARAAAFIDSQRLLFVDAQQRIGITDIGGSGIRIIGSVASEVSPDGFHSPTLSFSNDGDPLSRAPESDVWKMSPVGLTR